MATAEVSQRRSIAAAADKMHVQPVQLDAAPVIGTVVNLTNTGHHGKLQQGTRKPLRSCAASTNRSGRCRPSNSTTPSVASTASAATTMSPAASASTSTTDDEVEDVVEPKEPP